MSNSFFFFLSIIVLTAHLCMTLCDPWTHPAPLSIELSRQEYWSRLPFPTPMDLPNPGIETESPTLQDSLTSEPLGKPYKVLMEKKIAI